MTKYQMEDGVVVNTDKASAEFEEDTSWNGNNHISVNTGSQWNHQKLYRSSKGRYYLVHSSQWQGSTPHAEWVSNQEAARWLLANDYKLPDELADLEAELTE